MRLLNTAGKDGTPNETDPRENESAEVIDLASRTAYPAVAQRKGVSDGLGLAAGVAIVGLLGAVTLWSMNSARVAEPETIGSDANSAAPQPNIVEADPIEVMPPISEPSIMPSPAPIAPVDRGAAVAMAPATNPYATPTMVFDSSINSATATTAPETALAPGQPVTGGGLGSAAEFASRIGGVGGAPAQARAMTNPSTTVTQGTLIPAILETAIDTDVPGYVRAVVSQDVRSFDGTKILVPRSSRLIGQYQSGLQGGQKRAYVIWTRLIRPDGASVNLASPAVSFDGTTGLQGDVNSNFFKRFGSAMLLSVVGGLSALATSGASVVLGGAGESAAAAAVQQDGQIGPTVRVRQGEPIRVFTARDLDFSPVS